MPKSKQLFDEIEQGEGRGFYCFDWNDEFQIYGDETQDSKYVEIFLLPCNYLHQSLGYEDDSVSEECIWDLQEQKDYIESLQVLLYINDEQY